MIANKQKDTGMFDLVKSDPIPAGRLKHPFSRMDVGDSFAVADKSLQKKMVVAAHTYGWASGKKFRTQTIDGITKIWRIA